MGSVRSWFRQRVKDSRHHRAPELAGRPGTCDCGPGELSAVLRTVVCVDLRSVGWSECYKRNEELLPGQSLLWCFSSVALWLCGSVALSRLTTRDSRLAESRCSSPPGSRTTRATRFSQTARPPSLPWMMDRTPGPGSDRPSKWAAAILGHSNRFWGNA
jgi:hypothetical protein